MGSEKKKKTRFTYKVHGLWGSSSDSLSFFLHHLQQAHGFVWSQSFKNKLSSQWVLSILDVPRSRGGAGWPASLARPQVTLVLLVQGPALGISSPGLLNF